MDLGLRSKIKGGSSVQVDYTIHIQEIKPWPPSQSLKSLRSVVLQWENGDRNSGSTTPVAPSLEQSKIEFNESFKLKVIFLKENSGKSNNFQKNVLELNLFELRRDKTVKGQLLGSASVDLAEHGIVKEAVSFGIPLNCKRSYGNTAKPVVYVKIQPFDKESSSSLSRESLSKEASLDKDGRESVSALMCEEYAEEAEIASFSDDDVSSHSSFTNSASALKANADFATQTQSSHGEQAHDEYESEAVKESRGQGNAVTNLPLEPVPPKPELEPVTAVLVLNGTAGHQDRSLPQSLPVELSIDAESLGSGNISLSNSSQRSSALVSKKSDTATTHSSLSCATDEGVKRNDLHQDVQEKMVDCRGEENVVENPASTADFAYQREMPNPLSTAEPERSTDDKKPQESRDGSDEVENSHGADDIFVDGKFKEKQKENVSEEEVEEVQNHSIEIESSTDSSPDNGSIASVESLEYSPVIRQHKYLQNALNKPVNSDMTMSSRRVLGEKGSRTLTSDRLMNMRFSMRSPPRSLGSIRYATSDQYMEDAKEIDVLEDVCNGGLKSVTHDRIDESESIISSSDKVKHVSRSNRNNFNNNKVRALELRIEMLEGELREAAAIEIGLFSIVAEHGSSVHKVHTPARRLSRLYIHASKQWSRERKASAARSAVSGLVLVAKACGNDVPRLTFWLSNSVVLRAIVTREIGHSDLPDSHSPYPVANGSQPVAKGKSSPLRWESTPRKKEKFSFSKEFDDWENLYTFIAALERIESWMFSRIIESIWWQTFTPHMQSSNEGGEPKTSSHVKKNFGRIPSLGDQQQANLSTEIWKKAFDDACERLCPVRAEGHECGCLPMLARLAMEQCVARLDVAMFNAILCETDDEIPTDPVSDPISDPKVLPIPPGKSSFGAGAQLKNAIGNWSRWLTDLFGMDVGDSPQNKNEQDGDRLDVAASFKSFHLLNALSDLLMLPKDMLLEKSIRKEVCPTFSASLIKQVLCSFLPDEFCPDPILEEVLEALDSEDPLEGSEEGIRNVPCNVTTIIYSPPSVASIESVIGDVRSTSLLRSGSSVVRKCHTSDDELDELDSPLASIVIENSSTPTAKLKGNSSANAVRYQLLRDVWRNHN